MDRYQIQDKVSRQWEGTGDNTGVLYAIETARTDGVIDTVNVKWRWLAIDLLALYHQNADLGAACYNFISGWIQGATSILTKALLKHLGE